MASKGVFQQSRRLNSGLEDWCFLFTYMGNHARKVVTGSRCLKRGSAAQYCSSVKVSLPTSSGNEPDILQDNQWSKHDKAPWRVGKSSIG
jgi:hypothetical protein